MPIILAACAALTTADKTMLTLSSDILVHGRIVEMNQRNLPLKSSALASNQSNNNAKSSLSFNGSMNQIKFLVTKYR